MISHVCPFGAGSNAAATVPDNSAGCQKPDAGIHLRHELAELILELNPVMASYE